MMIRLLADAVLVLHLGFMLFVGMGALAVAHRPAMLPAHLAAAGWGVLVEAAGLDCPLTRLEQALRRAAGEAGYAGGFIDHYVTAAIYPAGLTRPVQMAIGAAVLAWNAALYYRMWRHYLALRLSKPNAGTGERHADRS